MKTLATLDKLLMPIVVLLCFTALCVVGLWGNKYAGYYVAWILLIGYFTWQARKSH